MTLDEAITHATDVAKQMLEQHDEQNAIQHTKLAFWLLILKQYKEHEEGTVVSTKPFADEIDKNIEGCLEKAKCDCSSCGREHQQLAEWLTELKEYWKSNDK